MAEKMNRQHRREMQKQERMRQKRAERAVAKRRRVRSRWQERRREASSQLPIGSWLARPYKSADMLLLFLSLWGLRWLAMRYVGGETAPAPELTTALLVAQAAFALIVLLYIAGIARDGFQWSGPPDHQLPPAFVWGGGIVGGLVVYSLGRVFTQLLASALPAGSTEAEVGLTSPVVWSNLGNMDPALAVLSVVSFALLIPLGDEFYYRRILGRIFSQSRMSEGWIIVSTGLLYTLGSGGVFPLPAAAAGGLVLGFVWMRTQSMGIVIIAHVIQAAVMMFTG